MYKCHDCGETFASPKTVKVCLGEYAGTPALNEETECPICGSDDFDAAELCESCGEYLFSIELDEGYCENCQCAVIEAFERNYSEAEIEIIRNHLANEVA